ncbi:carbohydrate ABC transporter permease [Leucobacter triazinivorans]|uniref:Sugar ABC transporter permease n=1 Tax=Leucobacter triazinivorans TaxID=1784719 RepID=A0A4P6KC86_9MICO|nr:sugar ABC transporter permease [Leucobacter triazinivorans]QBE47713.1 sugar ABC transporter permease [Leucobacter triazinivorans]
MKHKTLWAWIFLSLPLAAYTIIVFVPAVISFSDSMTNASTLGGDSDFVGFANYQRLFGDEAFWSSLRVTVVWTVVAVTAPVALSLLIAVMLGKLTVLGKFVKTMFFLPLALSLVVVGQVWMWLMRPDNGLINIVLQAIGLGDLARPWLADSGTALAAVLVAWSWQQIALGVIIFLAGLTGVSADLSEAAKLDGASHWQHFRHVTWPALNPALIVVMSLALINALKSFDIVYVMTSGGPFRTTETLALFSYRIAFTNYDAGYSSAAVVILFLLTTAIIGTFFWWTGRKGAQQ